MKKLSLLCIGLFSFAFSSIAQLEEGRLSFGLRAGVNFQNLNGKDASGATLKNGLVVRYHGGINLEIPLVPDFYIQPNLLFSTKGAKIKQNISGANNTNYTVNLYYLELPVNFLYKPLLGSGHLLLGFGPYLAYGIGGKAALNNNKEKISFSNNNFGNNITYKPLDAGANLLFGYEFASKISIQLNAQLGLVPINIKSNMAGNQASVKNTGFGLSMGYRF